jgi:hypothetical protein
LTFSDWWLFRLEFDGALDLGFGTDGLVVRQDTAPKAMALQPDGKVVTAGFVEQPVYMPPMISMVTSHMVARNGGRQLLRRDVRDGEAERRDPALSEELTRRSGKRQDDGERAPRGGSFFVGPALA